MVIAYPRSAMADGNGIRCSFLYALTYKYGSVTLFFCQVYKRHCVMQQHRNALHDAHTHSHIYLSTLSSTIPKINPCVLLQLIVNETALMKVLHDVIRNCHTARNYYCCCYTTEFPIRFMMMLCVCLYDVGNTKLNNEGSVPISKCKVPPKQTHFSVEATWHVILVRLSCYVA